MCGISGIVEAGGETGAREALAVMHDVLRRRGPDGEGFLLGSADGRATHWSAMPPANAFNGHLRYGLAFRQLRIQDLTATGAQPMSSADGRVWLLLNGEIYNYRELRRELQGRGHRFSGTSDTEVALASFREWGIDCFTRFNGMWAMLFVDLDQRIMIGSRDRLGIKPLFYGFDGKRLLLASDPQAIALARRHGPAIEMRRFAEFLRGLPPQSATLSFFRDIHPVPAGTWFEIPLDGSTPEHLSFRTFWNLADYATADENLDWHDALDEFHSLLKSSIDQQSRAAVEVGCLVSGGIDSSTVAAMLAQQRRHDGAPPPQVFSIVYDDPEMSEQPYVWAIARHAGLRSHRHTFAPDEAWDSVDRVVRLQGQPLLGQDVIAQERAYALARACGTTVVLEGQGADELLAGVPLYERVYLRELVLGRHAGRLMTEMRLRRRLYQLSWPRAVRRYLLGPALLSTRAGTPAYGWMARGLPRSDWPEDESPDPSLLNRYLFRMVRHTNLPVVLLYQDRNSMAHSVESRVPFLDHRLVELCFRLPASFKAGLGTRKRILRTVAANYLPSLILDRRDKKMLVSKTAWFPLRSHANALRAMAADRAIRDCPALNGSAVERFVDDFLRGHHDDAPAVWRLYTAWRWLLAFHLT